MTSTVWAGGVEYGTAGQITRRLTRRGSIVVTTAMLRNWAARDGLRAVRVGRTVYYDIIHAATIEHAKRTSGRGRHRPVDDALVAGV
jgi:hypothetical protein